MSHRSITEIVPPRKPQRSGLDVRKLRRDFPILSERVRGKPLVYLDNSATTQKPRQVLDAVENYYTHDNANVHRAVHLLSERATQAYEAARVKVQHFIHAADSREIIYTRGTTDAINLVAQSYGRKHIHAGDEIVLSQLEHHSNIVPWQMLCEEKGAILRVVPLNNRGEFRLDEYEKLLGSKTKLVAVAHVSNALGSINPVRQIIDLAHRRGVPVLIDGAQAVSHMRVDVQEFDCDFYAFSGHKMYGPTGIGILYGKASLLDAMPPYQGGGDMISSVTFAKTTYNVLPYKFEAGTPHIAGAVGLGAAIDFIEAIGRDAIAAHEERLLERAVERLSAIPGVRLIGEAEDRAAVVSFVVDDPPMSALDVGTRLDLEGIAIRTGHHCCQPLMDWYQIPGTARASFAVYNTWEEVETFASALEKIVRDARHSDGGPTSQRLPEASARRVKVETVYPPPAADSPQAAAEEQAETFDFLEEWPARYEHLIELGKKLLPLPDEFRTEENRVRGCQSTVYFKLRARPGSADIVEFLAVSDADIVCGLIALLQKVYCGQKAREVLAFDVQGFFRRLGLDNNLVMGRRIGLDSMVQRVRDFAASLTQG